MSVSGIIISIGIALSSIAGTVLTASDPPEIVHADVVVISPTPTPTNTPTPTPTMTPIATPMPTNTPTPTFPPPTPIPVSHTSDDLEGWFTRYSSQYGVDRELLRRIAACESGFNATSHNTKHGYAGMYQFSAGTWQGTRRAMGEDEHLDLRFNAEEAIKTAAFKISRGGAGAWPVCSR